MNRVWVWGLRRGEWKGRPQSKDKVNELSDCGRQQSVKAQCVLCSGCSQLTQRTVVESNHRYVKNRGAIFSHSTGHEMPKNFISLDNQDWFFSVLLMYAALTTYRQPLDPVWGNEPSHSGNPVVVSDHF